MMPKCSICKKKTIMNKHVMLKQQLKQLKQRHCPTSVFFINLQNKISKSFFFFLSFSENTKRKKYIHLLKQSLSLYAETLSLYAETLAA
jgi:hypothetical protein